MTPYACPLTAVTSWLTLTGSRSRRVSADVAVDEIYCDAEC